MTQTAAGPLTISSGDLTLEGVLQLPSVTGTPLPAVVVCHPHPQYGGDMDNNVVIALCQALGERGFATLRFNFRGVGRSEGEFDPAAARDDVGAAIRHLSSLPEVDEKRIGLAGYSFGALMAAEVASGALRALALVSPPIAVGDLRVAWGCPALIVAGDGDDFAPSDRLRVAAEPVGVELHIVEGADHFWWGFEDEMGETVGAFFGEHFR